MATLESAKHNLADLGNINTICNAIKVRFEYGIIFNNLDKELIEKIQKEAFKT